MQTTTKTEKALCERCGARRRLKRVILTGGDKQGTFDLCRECKQGIKEAIRIAQAE